MADDNDKNAIELFHLLKTTTNIAISECDIRLMISNYDSSIYLSLPVVIDYIENNIISIKGYKSNIQLKYLMITIAHNSIRNKSRFHNLTRHYDSFSRLIAKLYHCKLFELDDLFILFKFLIALDVNNYKVISHYHIKMSLLIAKYVFINEFGEEEKNMLADYLKVFNQMVLNSEENIHFIYSNINIIQLLIPVESNNKNINSFKSDKLFNTFIDLFSKIYLGRFDNQIVNTFLIQIHSILLNYNIKPFQDLIKALITLNIQISSMRNLVFIEKSKLTNIIKQGFYFGNENRNGIKLKPNIKLTKFSFVFIFNSTHPNLSQFNQTLISFRANDVISTNLISFSIDCGKLKVYQGTNEQCVTPIIIIPNKSVLCVITGSKKLMSNKYCYEMYCDDQYYSYHSQSQLVFKENINCFIGYTPLNTDTQYNFVGKIGSVMCFNHILNNKLIKFLDLFKYDTESILIDSSIHKASYNDKEETITPIWTEAISNQKGNNIYQDIKECQNEIAFVLSPNDFYFSNDNDNRNKFMKYLTCYDQSSIHLVSPFSSDFFVFQTKYIVNEILNSNGMKMILLHIQYYYQLVLLFEDKEYYLPQIERNAIVTAMYDYILYINFI